MYMYIFSMYTNRVFGHSQMCPAYQGVSSFQGVLMREVPLFLTEKAGDIIALSTSPPLAADWATPSPRPNCDISGPSCPEVKPEWNRDRADWNWGDERMSSAASPVGGR